VCGTLDAPGPPWELGGKFGGKLFSRTRTLEADPSAGTRVPTRSSTGGQVVCPGTVGYCGAGRVATDEFVDAIGSMVRLA